MPSPRYLMTCTLVQHLGAGIYSDRPGDSNCLGPEPDPPSRGQPWSRCTGRSGGVVGTGSGRVLAWGSTSDPLGRRAVRDARARWEIAELVAALGPGIASRLLAGHPADGWCRSCRASAPCSTRSLAEVVEQLP